MSFSSEVKEELRSVVPKRDHCRTAEAAGRVLYAPQRTQSCFTSSEKAFKITVSKEEEIAAILKRDCCRRAFLRGAYLSAGTVSTPEKYYRLEFVCPSPKDAERILNILTSFDLTARITKRKNTTVLYLKEGEQIVYLLGLMGANRSLLELESIRVVREMRGAVNRKVNCETANLQKTVQASMNQLEDIRTIKRKKEYSTLSPSLREIAEVRMANPEVPLSELGGLLHPPVGKSGVNHRIRRIHQIAEEIRKKETGVKKKEGKSND